MCKMTGKLRPGRTPEWTGQDSSQPRLDPHAILETIVCACPSTLTLFPKRAWALTDQRHASVTAPCARCHFFILIPVPKPRQIRLYTRFRNSFADTLGVPTSVYNRSRGSGKRRLIRASGPLQRE